MAQNLSERLLAMAQHDAGMRRRCNFPLLLAQRDQILLSLRDGWSLIQIWEMLRREGKVTAGYATFTRQVRRMLHGPVVLSALPAYTAASKRTKSQNNDGFTFDSTPNKEDLL